MSSASGGCKDYANEKGLKTVANPRQITQQQQILQIFFVSNLQC